MWLISSDRAELQEFLSPEAVPGGYAILSHVWAAHEQTFQETKALMATYKDSVDTPRDHSTDKVRRCCELAERNGYQWIWNDTCCINKESSAELSEAINSMFRWYELASVCYAYLGDVPSHDDMQSSGSAFRRSRWHTRGWTLQELIAPRNVVFVSQEWEVLGKLGDLVLLLANITGIPPDVLMRTKRPVQYSIAARMSWAANRTTTRLEDEAYCLMGLFDIHMPTLYGEGQKAFRRLQEEILKQSIDTSIFAWGLPIFATGEVNHSLFASSPAQFVGCRDITSVYTPPKTDLCFPSFSVTAYGVLASLPVATFRGHTLGLLRCTVNRCDIALVLSELPSERTADPKRPLFKIGDRHGRLVAFYSPRLHPRSRSPVDRKDPRLPLLGQRVHWRSRKVYLVPATPHPGQLPPVPGLSKQNCTPDTPCRTPEWVVALPGSEWGLVRARLTQHPFDSSETGRSPTTRLMWTHSGSCRPPLELSMDLGLCMKHTTRSWWGNPIPVHWVRFRLWGAERWRLGRDGSEAPEEHDCLDDHVIILDGSKPLLKRAIVDVDGRLQSERGAQRYVIEVRAAFTVCPFRPWDTIVLEDLQINRLAGNAETGCRLHWTCIAY